MARAPLKATFFAFRRREQGSGALTRATLVHAALVLVLVLTFLALGPRTMQSFFEATSLGAVEPPVAFATFGGLAVVFCYFIALSSYEAACLGWLTRSERGGFMGFSLGGATWNVYFGAWIWTLFAIVAFFVGALLTATVLSAMDVPPIMEGPWASFAVISVWLIAAIVLGVPLAPGNATSVASRRFAYFGGWRVGASRFFALCGSFAILWLIWGAVFFMVFIASVAIFTLAFAGAGGAPATPDDAMWLSFATGLGIAHFVFTFLAAGVNARAVLAAIEEGKLPGLTADVVKAFE